MQRDVRIFEVGAAFVPGEGVLPREELRVAALITGHRRPPHFTEPSPPDFDEWDAKGLAEEVARAVDPAAQLELRPGCDDTLWEMLLNGELRGRVCRVRLDAPVWAAPAFGVEMTLAVVDSAVIARPGAANYAAAEAGRTRTAAPAVRYRALPVTPAAEFDLALLVPNDVPAERVERAMRAAAGELLERLVLFDEFRGATVPEGFRSIAWRLTFRHPERTLREKEIAGRREKLLRTLEGELGVRQRTS